MLCSLYLEHHPTHRCFVQLSRTVPFTLYLLELSLSHADHTRSPVVPSPSLLEVLSLPSELITVGNLFAWTFISARQCIPGTWHIVST